MALGKCRECGRECAKTAKVCPSCGVANPVKGSASAAVLGVVFVGLVVTYVAVSSGTKPSSTVTANPVDAVADLGMDGIYKKVCTDAVEQYNIAKRNGTPIDACAHAGMVAAAFLQAKDERNYALWKKTEKSDCVKAGMPR
jgi:hypothetical protein